MMRPHTGIFISAAQHQVNLANSLPPDREDLLVLLRRMYMKYDLSNQTEPSDKSSRSGMPR